MILNRNVKAVANDLKVANFGEAKKKEDEELTPPFGQERLIHGPKFDLPNLETEDFNGYDVAGPVPPDKKCFCRVSSHSGGFSSPDFTGCLCPLSSYTPPGLVCFNFLYHYLPMHIHI